MIHGTHGAYFNGGCRCPACKEAAHRYYVEVARPRREGERVEPNGEAHPLVAYASSLSKKSESCSNEMTLDVVERAKKLAGIEEEARND